MSNRLDLFDRPLKIGDEVGGQAWGHTGTVQRMIVRGFTDKKVRVEVQIPERQYTAYPNRFVTIPASTNMTHAYARELVKTGRNEFD